MAGPLRAAALDVARAADGPNVLGMDVLGQHRCVFRLDAGVVVIDEPDGVEAGHPLLLGERCHPYVDLHWPGVTGRAAWDTGSGATLVNRDFWLAHPELFDEVGSASGTDSRGTRMQTPLLRMTAPVIGGREFRGHLASPSPLRGELDAQPSDGPDRRVSHDQAGGLAVRLPGPALGLSLEVWMSE